MPGKFEHLDQGKTKLDPCSRGTPLQNMSNLMFTQKRPSDTKGAELPSSFRDFIFSEDIRGRGSEMVFPFHARKVSLSRPRENQVRPM